jgi:hypothetical protein
LNAATLLECGDTVIFQHWVWKHRSCSFFAPHGGKQEEIALHHVLTDGKHRRLQPLGNYAVTTTSGKSHARQVRSADRIVEQKLDQITHAVEALADAIEDIENPIKRLPH